MSKSITHSRKETASFKSAKWLETSHEVENTVARKLKCHPKSTPATQPKPNMADHYRTLGVTKSATKEEIKEAFRKLAIQFHPDKHAHSPQSTRDAATSKFKQLSEAYQVLIDDRKRAAYNISCRHNNSYGGGGYSSYYNNSNANTNYGGGGYGANRSSYKRPAPSNASRWVTNMELVLMYMTTRSFLLNLAFAGILLGGIVAIDMSGESLWKLQNSGKSFEDAIDSIEKNKARKGKH